MSFRPAIIGCRTTSFSAAQLADLAHYKPYGMILFREATEAFKLADHPDALQKNIETASFVIKQFRDAVGNPNAPIFIDNEGGRVMRLRPEGGFAPTYNAIAFRELAEKDLEQAKAAVFLHAQIIAHQMQFMGRAINFAPVADLLSDNTFDSHGAHDANALVPTSGKMGDRIFSRNPAIVAALNQSFLDGLNSLGVGGCIKHSPGYGRVGSDPHLGLDFVQADLSVLEQTDFAPFKALNTAPMFMMGHAIYERLYDGTDAPQKPASRCPHIIKHIIREVIGFKNVLTVDSIEMAGIGPELFNKDDINGFGMMNPFKGAMGQLTQECLNAGIDLVLHSDCSRKWEDTLEILEAATPMTPEKLAWVDNTLNVTATVKDFDMAQAQAQLKALLG